jgi:AbrB family looped-hinge helix DNA binding protein
MGKSTSLKNEWEEDGVVVSVTAQGQATIPKRFRLKLGIEAPGRVRFVEDEDGEVYLERVQSFKDFRGILDTEKSAHELVSEARAEDKAKDEEMLKRHGVDGERD